LSRTPGTQNAGGGGDRAVLQRRRSAVEFHDGHRHRLRPAAGGDLLRAASLDVGRADAGRRQELVPRGSRPCRRRSLALECKKTPRPKGKIMMELAGKTAFVTGGASGIGLALAQALAQAGMNVMLADIESTALTAAVGGLSDQGLTNVRSVTCDVADRVSVEEAAEATFKAFGAVHVVCNNAGVAGGSGIDDISI